MDMNGNSSETHYTLVMAVLVAGTWPSSISKRQSIKPSMLSFDSATPVSGPCSSMWTNPDVFNSAGTVASIELVLNRPDERESASTRGFLSR